MGYFSRRKEDVDCNSDVDIEKTVELYLEQLESKAFFRNFSGEQKEKKGEFLYRIPVNPLRIENLDFIIDETYKLLKEVKTIKRVTKKEEREVFDNIGEVYRLI